MARLTYSAGNAGKTGLNFLLKMICSRTSCVYDIVEVIIDHWIKIKPFLSGHMCRACHFKPNHDHNLLWKAWMSSCYEQEEETSATFLTEQGRSTKRFVEKRDMITAKSISAKPTNNMQNTIMQIW